MSATIQLMIVLLIGLWSLVVIAQRVFPSLSKTLRERVALRIKPQYPRLAAWLITPSSSTPKCAMACSDCRPSCNSEKPVQWR